MSERNGRAVGVLVADDHPVFRRGVAKAIERRAELTLAGEHGDGEAALSAIREHPPDIALLDVVMPVMTGLEVLTAVVDEDLPTRVVLLSGYPDPETIYRAVTGGAAGFLSKHATGDDICDRLVAVARGETVLAPEVQGELAGRLRAGARMGPAVLTPREREILGLIAAGETAPAIADRLGLSPATVRTHLQHLYDKLGVSDRAAAVAQAMRRGLLD